jgi:hypothetical protein
MKHKLFLEDNELLGFSQKLTLEAYLGTNEHIENEKVEML